MTQPPIPTANGFEYSLQRVEATVVRELSEQRSEIKGVSQSFQHYRDVQDERFRRNEKDITTVELDMRQLREDIRKYQEVADKRIDAFEHRIVEQDERWQKILQDSEERNRKQFRWIISMFILILSSSGVSVGSDILQSLPV